MIVFDYESHIIFAVLIGFGLDYFLLQFTFAEMILYYTFIIVGSVLPDVDTPYSFIGKKLRPVSDLLYKFVGHRTLTHSILVITIIFFAGVFLWEINTIVVGLMLGAVIHVLGDMLTPQGVALVYPVSKKRFKFLK